MNCFSLKRISIPNSVIDIDKNVFYNCTKLKEINGINLKEGVNIINNRFILFDRGDVLDKLIFKIIHQIGDDYICDNEVFIDDKIY
jgi:hypothetical protein